MLRSDDRSKLAGALIAILLFSFGSVRSGIQVAWIFTDNMVLQRGIKIPVWGSGTPGEKVHVQLIDQIVSTACDKDGQWKIYLEPVNAGGPYTMKIESESVITLENILVGDVWLCSGQSNMWRPVSSALNPEQEIKAADYPEIRLFSVPRTFRKNPVKEIPIPHPDEQRITTMRWEVCNSNTIRDFSAVGYFFGREVHVSQNVPIGLIKVCWGNTKVESWMSLPSLMTVSGFENVGREIADPVQLLDSVTESFISRIPVHKDPGFRNNTALWAAPDLNTSSWNIILLPQFWEDQFLENFDGVVWFKKKFHLPDLRDKKESILGLGDVRDANITWVNGYLIGQNKGKIPGSPYYQSNPESAYPIDPEVLNTGENDITVRVINYVGPGGISGATSDLFFESGDFRLSLTGKWLYKKGLQAESDAPARVRPHQIPTVLYNGMIHPLIPFGIRGIIWYQGESNTGNPDNYFKLFSTLIDDWRQRWGQGNFPFLFVQLANYGPPPNQPESSSWALIREEQFKTLSLENTGMAVAIDIGEAGDIHPENKQDVGHRLALVARNHVYGEELVSSGPVFNDMAIDNNAAILSFHTYGDQLTVRDRYGYVRGFSIAGQDKKFYWAKGYALNDKVIVYSKDVKDPVAVRYAWADNPEDPNLYNSIGLPAVPFRTDNWE